MKKAKKERTLKELKRMQKNAAILLFFIVSICSTMLVLLSGLSAIMKFTLDDNVYLLIMMIMFLSFVIWMMWEVLYLHDKIRDKEDMIKLAKIKDIAKQGNIKNNIILNNEEFLNDILSNNIEKILFRDSKYEIITLEIYFVNGYCIPIRIKKDEIFSIFTDNDKETILSNIIDSITIEDLEKEKMKVKIDTKGYNISQRAGNYNLLGWFELKN